MIDQTFDTYGPPDAPVVVLLHAASYTRKMWLPQVSRLAQTYRVLALDLPGHGTLAGQAFTFADAVCQVADVLDREGIAEALLVGVSLGGCVAMDFAAQFPLRAAGLVISGSTFDPRTRLCKLVLRGESIIFPYGAARFTHRFHHYLRARCAGAMAEEIISAGTYWQGAAQAVHAMIGVDFRAKLAAYPRPTLILNGERDWVHRTAERSFARAAQNARIQIIPGAGHIANLDEPAAFTQAVLDFAEFTAAKEKLIDETSDAGIDGSSFC